MEVKDNKITVICGHYGCGKTNLTLNLALRAAETGKKVTVVDMDIVNPYFRSSEYRELLEKRGIRLIAPVFAGTTLDTPTLPPDIASIFEEDRGTVLIDAGGDDAGVTALGGLHERLEAAGYDMLYVINRCRVLSQTPEEAAGLLKEIESASRLKACGIVNNSHLGVETTLETLLEALPFAEKTAELTGLPLLCSTAPDFSIEKGEPLPEGFFTIKRLVKFFWEEEH
ncbi:MAG: ParA family protein [Acutalibacter sp.]|nr:ParA family protein [Acutalibacter sp.]